MYRITGKRGELVIKKPAAFCGVGNRMRRDDGFGPAVIDGLKAVLPPGSERRDDILLLDCGEVPENYLDRIVEFRPRQVVFIDAASLDIEPGALAVLRPSDILNRFSVSTHQLPLGLVFSLIERQVPWVEILLLAVQIESCDFGEGLTAAVEASRRFLVDLLAELMKR